MRGRDAEIEKELLEHSISKVVFIDDTWYYIDIESPISGLELTLALVSPNLFRDAVEALLTASQIEKFHRVDTERRFKVSNRRLRAMYACLDNSIWIK